MNMTEKEKQVWKLMSQGLNSFGISKTLRIEESTVKTHIVHIYDKLGLTGLSKYRNLQTTAALMYLNRYNNEH